MTDPLMPWSLASLMADTSALLFVFGVLCIGILLGHFGLLKGKSTYLDLVNAWWKLNVTHRYDMLVLREYFNILGVPLQLVADHDVLVLGSCVASLASYAGVRHRGSSRIAALA